jgi:hypothetical protein
MTKLIRVQPMDAALHINMEDIIRAYKTDPAGRYFSRPHELFQQRMSWQRPSKILRRSQGYITSMPRSFEMLPVETSPNDRKFATFPAMNATTPICHSRKRLQHSRECQKVAMLPKQALHPLLSYLPQLTSCQHKPNRKRLRRRRLQTGHIACTTIVGQYWKASIPFTQTLWLAVLLLMLLRQGAKI